MGSVRYFFLLLSCLISFSIFSQEGEPILLKNPSFEGVPTEGSLNGPMISGWYDCGFPNETSPDVHPKAGSTFGVDTQPFDGNSYIGMVVRDNETWEKISQRLSSPLMADQCYEFTISLARSLTYESGSRTADSKNKTVNFATPIKLRIWGGNSICGQEEMLGESSLIINSRWLLTPFTFNPKKNYQYIIFEAYYKTPWPFPYNGNLLMDNASPIIPVPCEAETPKADPPVVFVPPTTPPTPTPPNNGGVSSVSDESTSPSAAPKILADLDRSKIMKGTTIQIDQLYFQSDSFAITSISYPVLNEIHDFLTSNPDVKVEIGGHTNNIPSHEYCDLLSTKRAKAVADFLAQKGILRDRIIYKGYGKRNPLVSNSSPGGRKKNQRVEIKILSFDG